MAFINARSTVDSLMGPALRPVTAADQANQLASPRQRRLRDARIRSETNLLLVSATHTAHLQAQEARAPATVQAHASALAAAKEEQRLYQQQLRNFSRPLVRTSSMPLTLPDGTTSTAQTGWSHHDKSSRKRSHRNSVSGGRRNKSTTDLPRRRFSLAPVQEVASPADERATFLMDPESVARGMTPSPRLQSGAIPALEEVANVVRPVPVPAFTRVSHRSSTTADWLLRHNGSPASALSNTQPATTVQSAGRIDSQVTALPMAARAATLSPAALARCLDALQLEEANATPLAKEVEQVVLCSTPGLLSAGESSADDGDSLAESLGSTASSASTTLTAPTPVIRSPEAAVKKHERRASLTGDLWRGLKRAF